MKTNQNVQRLLSRIALPFIVLSIVLVFFIGCKKTEEPNPNNVDDSEVINPKYVPIDWDNATLLQSNDSIGDYEIRFDAEMPELQPGSIITIDQDTVVHHIFIETVDVDGNTVRVTSTKAYLTDIFANIDFTLSTADENKSPAKRNIFFPTAIYQIGDDGIYKELDIQASRADGWGFTHNLWHFDSDYDDLIVHCSNHDSVYMKKLNFNFDIDFEMYMNFSGRSVHEIVNNVIDRYRSNALNVNAYLVGNFETEQQIYCKAFGSFDWHPEYDLWKHRLFPPLRTRFIVYGVPVVITLNSDLYRQVQVNGSGDITAIAGFTDNAQGRLGFEWHQATGMSPVATFSNTFEFAPPPTLQGKGSATAKVWAIPRIRLILYDIIGPSFDIKPYLSTTVSGGFKEEMLGQSNDFCAWSLDCNTGLDAACGLSLQFMGYEIANYSTPNWNIINRSLYHSPKKIVHMSKGNIIKGQRRTDIFNVYDYNRLLDMDVLTPLPQFVKFEANSQLSSEYGIAHNGQVSVSWTPQGNEILYAKLYDTDGNVIAWDTVKAVEQDDDWVDLGLPSGLLWATRNVRALSPEQPGYYVAWAETQEKNYYDWETYRYYNTSTNSITKYNTIDGLTTLQQNDDAATYIMGNGQRMPTYDDWNELMNYCSQTYTTLNGVKGVQFTASNGNSIFLPAVGFRHVGGIFNYGQYEGLGFYWTSLRSEDNPNNAWFVRFDYNSEEFALREYLRLFGLSIRPVRSPN